MSDDTTPTNATDDQRDDPRSYIQQTVEARKDAVERGEGGDEPDVFTSAGMADGVGGTGGVVKNQEDDAQ